MVCLSILYNCQITQLTANPNKPVFGYQQNTHKKSTMSASPPLKNGLPTSSLKTEKFNYKSSVQLSKSTLNILMISNNQLVIYLQLPLKTSATLTLEIEPSYTGECLPLTQKKQKTSSSDIDHKLKTQINLLIKISYLKLLNLWDTPPLYTRKNLNSFSKDPSPKNK